MNAIRGSLAQTPCENDLRRRPQTQHFEVASLTGSCLRPVFQLSRVLVVPKKLDFSLFLRPFSATSCTSSFAVRSVQTEVESRTSDKFSFFDVIGSGQSLRGDQSPARTRSSYVKFTNKILLSSSFGTLVCLYTRKTPNSSLREKINYT